MGRADGADPALAAAPLLIGAHADAVGDDPGGLRLPGAGDNAAGVAVVLEVARALQDVRAALRRPVLVAAFDGEEAGAVGSSAHARALRTAGVRPLVVVLDNVARFRGTAAVEPGGDYDILLEALDRAARRLRLPLEVSPVASDNRPYAAAGFPTVGIALGGVGGHTPADTPDRVDPRALEVAGTLVLALVLELAVARS